MLRISPNYVSQVKIEKKEKRMLMERVEGRVPGNKERMRAKARLSTFINPEYLNRFI